METIDAHTVELQLSTLEKIEVATIQKQAVSMPTSNKDDLKEENNPSY